MQAFISLARTLDCGRFAEGVTEAMHGPDETGMKRIIAERRPDFAHQIGDFSPLRRCRARGGPATRSWRAPWGGFRRGCPSNSKRFRRERHWCTGSLQLVRIEIQHEVSKRPAVHGRVILVLQRTLPNPCPFPAPRMRLLPHPSATFSVLQEISHASTSHCPCRRPSRSCVSSQQPLTRSFRRRGYPS